MEKEIWKDIPNYEGVYKISNLGRIKSLDRVIKNKANKSGLANVKGRILSQAINVKNKYHFVNLSGKIITVHQLMAITFLNHKPDGHKLVVDHIDNDKTNNHLSNLRVITNRENTSQKHLKSKSKYVGVDWVKKTKKWRASIRINGRKKYLGVFDCELTAANAYQDKLKTII